MTCKSKLPLIFFLFLTLSGVAGSCSTGEKKSDDGKHLKGEVSVSGAFALYPLAVKWANDFQIQNPGVRISVSAGGAGKGMTDVMNGMVNFGMLSRELHHEETEKGAVAFVVGRDAVVPTVNSGNPLLPVIMAKGITQAMAGKAWTSMDCKTWGELLGIDDSTPLHVYTRSDACGAAQTWASFFGAKQEDLKGTAIYGDPGIANAVENDIYGLGFNNIAYAYDPETHLPPNHLTIFPVDVNGDGTVESNEMFYRRKEDIVKAIETGKYPSPPSRNLYFVSEGIPKDSASVAFIRYILKDGQKLNIPAGYVKTPSKIVSEQMHFIKHAVRSSEKDMKNNNTNLSVVVFLGIIVLVLSFLLPSFFFKSWNRRRIYKEKASSVFMFLFTVCSFFLLIAIILGLLYKSVPLLEHNTLWGLLSSREWKPSKNIFGFLPFIAGSVYVTVISMIIAVPLSLFTAIYLTEYSKKMIKKIVFPSLDILAAMPSVVYGIWGILILIPIFGYSLMTASLVLCVMVLPILVSLFVEIFSTVPKDLKDASTSLGATRWQTTKHVVLKKSLPGIFAAVVLALSKAVGETIAVMMVCGSIPKIPRSLMQGFYPLPALIGNNYGEMSSIPLYESAIMFAALILLVIVVIFNVLSRIILYRIQRNNE